jgi:carbonic anhydrase
MHDSHSTGAPAADAFADLLEANRHHREAFTLAGLPGSAARGLAVVTCIDTRIDPLAALGLAPGDAKITRNAGARVTDDVLRSLALATALLGVVRIAVVQHTDCALGKATDDVLRARVAEASGGDARGWEPLAFADQEATLRADLARVTASPLIPSGVVVGGFVYDVGTGELRPVT